ncbi:MAG TPA: bifunctional enoyl-CoA hydratase/phosphate acetyltransferase [Armatimonadota bacterium]|jgi:phosphate butyryltransferase
MINSFAQILEEVRRQPRRKLALANAVSASALQAAVRARDEDMAESLLFGARAEIERLAAENHLDLSGLEIADVPDELEAARQAVAAVREGRADLLMKGLIHSDDFLRALLDKEVGLRSGALMSHIFLLELPDRLLLITDGAMNIAPDLVTKAAIVLNAVYLANLLGNPRPKVGILAATELVNPAMGATLDAAVLATMARRGQFPDCEVDGPFALDNAVSVEAARLKKIPGDVAGHCDILLAPDIEAGNALAKAYSFLAGGRVAGVLVGAAAPVVLTSRADSDEAMMLSIATAVLMAQIVRNSRLKIGKIHC